MHFCLCTVGGALNTIYKVTLAKQAIAEDVQLVICIDEIHALLDSVSQSGFRAFQAMWTFMAALESHDVLMLATSATVRPRFESILAQELGVSNWR
jgi:hypothetical protein